MGNSDEGLGCWVVRLGILVLSVVRPPYTPSACRSALMPPIIHRAVLRRSRCAPLITCCTVGRDRRNARAIPGSTIAVLLCDPEVAPRRDALPSHLGRVADLSGMWIDRVHDHDPPRRVVLDMANSVSPTFGEQEGTAYSGHYGCTCYHPLFVFNQFGDLERCALRPGNVHSAHGWRDVLVPVVERYKERASRLYFRGDARCRGTVVTDQPAREAHRDRSVDCAPRALRHVPDGQRCHSS